MAGLRDYIGKEEKKRLRDVGESFRNRSSGLDKFVDRVGKALKKALTDPKSEERKKLEAERRKRFKEHKVKTKK